ncbi:MAG: hypothetical protein AB7S75_16280 [Desulfococcaceae bacterium]
MGLAWYIVSEKEIKGFDTFVDGKAIAHADEKILADIFSSLNVPPLMSFFSQNPEETGDFFDYEADIPENLPEEEWFSAADGLKTVRALTVHLQAHPESVAESEEILEDLKEYERILSRFEKEGIRWHLAIDF